jgi:hypothetical protein
MKASEPARLLIRLACFLPFASGLLLIDWISVQPPVRPLATRQFEAAADTLIAGKSIWLNASAGDLKAVWITRMRVPKEVVILGGSRAIQIPEEWFQPRSMFNAAVFQADLYDMVSVFQLLLETGLAPHLVVLDLNPSLTYSSKSIASPLLAPGFRHALTRYRIFPPRFFQGAFSLDGPRWELGMLLQPTEWGIADPSVPSGLYRIRPDGSTDWGGARADMTPDEAEAIAVSQMHHDALDVEHWRTTSQPGWFDMKILRAFLDDLQSRGIRVVVLLAPVHPAAYDFYTSKGGYDETWIRREMAARGITVVGSYSPSAARATRADFFDGVHPRLPILHRLLSEAGGSSGR